MRSYHFQYLKMLLKKVVWTKSKNEKIIHSKLLGVIKTLVLFLAHLNF